MSGRPKVEEPSKSFAIYEKTWLLLRDMQHAQLKKKRNSISLKELAHNAVQEYAKRRKNDAR